jgi:hypothetical protein
VPATNDILFDDGFAFIKADGILAGPVEWGTDNGTGSQVT